MFKKLSLLISAILTVISCGGSKQPEGRLMSYRYSCSGSMAQPIHDFTLKRIDDKTCQVIFFNHDAEPRTIDYEFVQDTILQPIQLIDSVETIVRQNKMWKYKEHYSPAFEVLDGNSWSLSFTFDGAEPSSSSGYHATPKGGGISQVVNMLKQYIPGI